MKRYIVQGTTSLSGSVEIAGSKNVVTKALIAACLTDEEITIHNVPLIDDFYTAVNIITSIGGTVKINGHIAKAQIKELSTHTVPFEYGALTRATSMFMAPLLARKKSAVIPNPGGCRLGARPIDRHIKGLEQMGAFISYNSMDGNFYAQTDGLTGANINFKKNTHTGTETVILAAVLADGTTVISNASEEPEVDDLISLLNKMGAKISRKKRTITINGVKKLHGADFYVMPDRNEAVTFAVLSAISGGNIVIKNAPLSSMGAFLEAFKAAGGDWDEHDGAVRFFVPEKLRSVDVVTGPHPSFMTDWQGPWAILMTQAEGESVIHETVYENRFAYVKELIKMGAKITYFQPGVGDPETFYNFNCRKNGPDQPQAIKITGKTKLHNAVLTIEDLRAGATLVLGSIIAEGKSVIYGIDHIKRGYEQFDLRLRSLGASITEFNGE